MIQEPRCKRKEKERQPNKDVILCWSLLKQLVLDPPRSLMKCISQLTTWSIKGRSITLDPFSHWSRMVTYVLTTLNFLIAYMWVEQISYGILYSGVWEVPGKEWEIHRMSPKARCCSIIPIQSCQCLHGTDHQGSDWSKKLGLEEAGVRHKREASSI